MKFCAKCGNQMSDDMLFCQKCGTRSISVETIKSEEKVEQKDKPIYSSPINNYSAESTNKNKANTMRKGMKIGMIVCFVFGVIYALISLMEPAILGMALFCFILGIMFGVLGKTPKCSKFLFGKEKGIKKSVFICVCILVAFVSFGTIMSTMEAPVESSTPTVEQTESNTESIVTDEPKKEKISLSDVEKWYKNEMPSVSQSLIEYSSSVKGISNMNVTESKFRFGEDSGWYDCHYTYYFTCKVNGEMCMGEARAFRKYNDSTINWFHFEITRDSDWSTVVEEYDESFDAIIEDYYKELVSTYK